MGEEEGEGGRDRRGGGEILSRDRSTNMSARETKAERPRASSDQWPGKHLSIARGSFTEEILLIVNNLRNDPVLRYKTVFSELLITSFPQLEETGIRHVLLLPSDLQSALSSKSKKR